MSDQDPDVFEPTIGLRVLLQLLRALGGRRGHAVVTWHGAGFRYTLTAVRASGPVGRARVDYDPNATDAADLVARVRDALHP